MERHPETSQNPASEWNALAAATRIARERQTRRERALIGAWVGATTVALVATCMLLEGCGGGGTHHAATASHVNDSPSTATAVVASNVPVEPAGGIETSQPLGSESVSDPGTVPPDMVVAVSDTFVTAGQAVQVSVEGTPDITEMALADGRGDAIPMVRDSSSQVWRVGYRVPLRPGTDRLGLSVTAKNDAQRWRRIWLFLNVDDGKHRVEVDQTTEPQTEVK